MAKSGAPRGIEFLPQPFVLASQSLTIALDPLQFGAQSSYFFRLLFDDGGGGFGPIGHATVMPEFRSQYKSNQAPTR
ncbi:MAG TPA: hypothetical protein VKW09_15845 [bacterium]|nr:hypothetical protein [bacterium]